MTAKQFFPWLFCFVLLFSLSACQKKDSYTDMIEVPVPGLTWGMTQDEVKDVLVEKYGFATDEIQFSEGTDIGCALDVASLGLEKIDILDLNVERERINLRFRLYDSVYRLDKVTVFVHANSGQHIQQQLTNAYGKPVSTTSGQVWVSVSPEIAGQKSDFEKLSSTDYDIFTRIAGGKDKLFTVRPVVVVQGSTIESNAMKALQCDDAAIFCLVYQGQRYLSSVYGSVVYG